MFPPRKQASNPIRTQMVTPICLCHYCTPGASLAMPVIATVHRVHGWGRVLTTLSPLAASATMKATLQKVFFVFLNIMGMYFSSIFVVVGLLLLCCLGSPLHARQLLYQRTVCPGCFWTHGSLGKPWICNSSAWPSLSFMYLGFQTCFIQCSVSFFFFFFLSLRYLNGKYLETLLSPGVTPVLYLTNFLSIKLWIPSWKHGPG